MRAYDSYLASAISATTTAFVLEGGVYALDAIATWGGGSLVLQRLGPDGSTYITADPAASLTANGSSGPMALPPGQYRLAVTTATALYGRVSRIPGE